jgi:hypothetical protein
MAICVSPPDDAVRPDAGGSGEDAEPPTTLEGSSAGMPLHDP